MLVKNKFLYFILVFLLLLSFCSNCFAASGVDNPTYENVKEYNIEIPYNVIEYVKAHYDMSLYGFWIDYWTDSNSYDVWLYNKNNYPNMKAYFSNITDRTIAQYRFYLSYTSFPVIQLKLKYDDLSVISTSNTSVNKSVIVDRLNKKVDGKLIFYSSFDVYTNNSYSSVFYHPPRSGRLLTVVEGKTMEVVLQEIITILPLILVVVVSFLGFRKAWVLLSKLLRQA